MIGKTLVCGDPHITPTNIHEGDALVKFIKKTATKNKIDTVLFLGDLFHTHAVVRVEVLDFWKRAFETLKKFKIICLVGNHDKIQSKTEEFSINALDVFVGTKNLSIINRPEQMGDIGLVPFMEDHDRFVTSVNDLYEKGATKCLIAHQTFTNAKFENGFYAPDGIDPELIPQDKVISGHIHAKQHLGKCSYPGTPKWDKASGAHQAQGIFLFLEGLDSDSYEFISTEEVVTPIKKHIINEGDELPKMSTKHKNYVELHGTSAWIQTIKKKLKNKARIKAVSTDVRKRSVNKNSTSCIFNYLDTQFKEIDGISKSEVRDYMTNTLRVAI